MLWLRSYKPPLTEEEKAAKKAASKKRKKKVKSEEASEDSKWFAIVLAQHTSMQQYCFNMF